MNNRWELNEVTQELSYDYSPSEKQTPILKTIMKLHLEMEPLTNGQIITDQVCLEKSERRFIRMQRFSKKMGWSKRQKRQTRQMRQVRHKMDGMLWLGYLYFKFHC